MEKNEEFFTKFKKELAKAGDPISTELFHNLESYIRWKGKEDSAKYSGKSMLRTLEQCNGRGVQVYVDSSSGVMGNY